MTDLEKYFSFCHCFDMASNGEITVAELAHVADRYKINFADFCDANNFVKSSTWTDAINEYKEQIAKGERG